jgi:hypothetical protein
VDGGVDNGSARLGAHIGVVMVMVLILVCTILSFYYDHGISVIDGGRPKIHHINMPLRPKVWPWQKSLYKWSMAAVKFFCHAMAAINNNIYGIRS